jgi:hypothetical protein
MSADSTLTRDRLRERLSYDERTGEFTHLTANSMRKAGHRAGCTNGGGYRSIMVDGTIYQAHRLAWLYAYGTWPSNVIDHINGDRTDNRLSNLRVVTTAGNSQNHHSARADSLSGLKGVSRKKDGRWFARITVDGNRLFLGHFDTAEQAHSAYVEAKRQMHPWWVEQVA